MQQNATVDGKNDAGAVYVYEISGMCILGDVPTIVSSYNFCRGVV